MVPAVRPLGSPSMARGCARIDSGPDTAKKAQPIASRSITPGYLQLLGYQKTFPHGLCHKQTHAPQQMHLYSITSSARTSSGTGIVIPIVSAVLRLITSNKRVGCSTGRSAGFAPLKILST
jgi:hypothetical protein